MLYAHIRIRVLKIVIEGGHYHPFGIFKALYSYINSSITSVYAPSRRPGLGIQLLSIGVQVAAH